MTIHVGDRIPEVTLKRIREGIETLDTHSLFDARKVVLFAVPGAFTPTCSARHLPGYVEKFEAFRQRGIDVYCMAVNDPFVMKAWAADQHVPDGLLMLSDGNAELTRALGLGSTPVPRAWASARAVSPCSWSTAWSAPPGLNSPVNSKCLQ